MTNIKIETINAGHYRAHFNQDYKLTSGATLSNFVLAFETLGKRKADNVILIHHSLATSCHVASHAGNPAKGWWEELIGPGKAIDTNKFYVICINNLGSCFGSTGPTSINPKTGGVYQANFPRISIEDMVDTQHMLLQALGINKLNAVIGGSMGGMLSLYWAHRYPSSVRNILAISMSHKSYPLHRAHRMCQRQAIYNDPNWADGFYKDKPLAGLKLARMISHLFYRGIDEVNQRFSENIINSPTNADDPNVISYYNYNADKFADQYDANTYILFLDAMDSFNLEQYGETLFNSVDNKTNIQIISTDTDLLYPPAQQTAAYSLLEKQGIKAKFIAHQSPFGHDAFLVDAQEMGEYIQSMIEHHQLDLI